MPVLSEQQIRILRGPQDRVAIIAALLFPTIVLGLAVSGMKLALIGAAGLGVLILMLANPEAATLIVLFVLYSNLAVVAARFHNVPQIMAVSFFVLLGIPFSYYVVLRRQNIIINIVFFLMLVAYFPVLLASAGFSRDPAQSTERVTGYVVEGLVLYFLVLNTVRTRTALRKAIWTLVLSGVLMGSLSLYQKGTHRFDRDFGGLAQVEVEAITTGGTDLNSQATSRPRAAGPIGEKNCYAQIMLVLLPLAIFQVWGERSRLLKALAMASCIPILGGILLTYSRGAGVSTLILLLFMMVLGYVKFRHFVACLCGAALITLVAVPDYVGRLSTLARLSSGNLQQAGISVRHRATENLGALKIFLDHPVLGVGAGQARLYIAAYGNEGGLAKIKGTRRAHNMYLEELAETGLIGFAFFMTIVLLTLRQLAQVRRHAARTRPGDAHVATGFLLAIIAYLVSAIFLQLAYVRYYWLLLALSAAAVRIFRQDSAGSFSESGS